MKRTDTGKASNSNNLLNSYARRVTSQGGEDGIIEKILEIIGVNDKWCVEFGSWDGKHLSNTYNLVANHGYSAVLIEGNKKRFKELQKNFSDNNKVIPINKFVGYGAENNLDMILNQTDIPKDFDILSIDVDGIDYHLWESTKQYHPKIVVIEFNSTVPTCVEFVQPKDMRIAQGSGLLSMVKLAKTKGYELIAIESANAFFVAKEYFGLFGINDNSINRLWADQSTVTHIFFGYDGTVFLRGLKVHPWQRLAIDESKMQLLPKWARKRCGGQSYLVRKLGKYYRKIKRIKS